MPEGPFITMLPYVTRLIEMAGVLVIVAGIGLAGFRYFKSRFSDAVRPSYSRLRATLGRAILLGLELLVAADIINTVAVEPTLEKVLVLGGIVLIRTFLSLSLEVEIEGRWPWQRAGEPRRSD
jgi:uncharacterized membrane protein